MGWKPTQAQLDEAFRVHLPYEIGRMVEAYRLLLNPEKYYQVPEGPKAATIAKALQDAHIVSFCTHARNLLEFFPREKYHEDNHYARAADFSKPDAADASKPDYEIRRRMGKSEALYKRLCAQVNHLTYDRTDEDGEKIGREERKELIDLVYGEVLRLAGSLNESQYDKAYLGLASLAETAAQEIKSGQTKQATNAVTAVSWQSPPIQSTNSTGTVISSGGVVTFNIIK